ncbi:sigma 54-interacting transcriptional regulator [Myxococcota bacterium]|nr:sigma 54-interacting transcriptional regulator [Myxococcota bacterium]MBU1429288.1 sigma 54-interacting transcriptional regulator [Myxococcota bacterium]
MPSLLIIGEERPHLLLRKLTSIGRDAENDVVLKDELIESTHAHIRIEDGRFIIVALKRGQPIWVNGRKIKKQGLEHDDEIKLGETRLRFRLWDEPAPSIERRSFEDEFEAYRRLADFSARLAERQEVSDLFEALMDEVISLTGADKGFLLMVDEEGLLSVRTARNIQRETIDEGLDDVSDSIIKKVLTTRKPLIVSDALNDTYFQSSRSVLQLKLCSVMCVPLIFQGSLLGLIYVGNNNIVNLFEQRSLEVLSVFASQAAMLMEHALQREALSHDNARLRQALEGQRFGEIIGSCDAMRLVFRKVEKVAATDISVLILGETGTGKELIAREIHRRSPRADGPFVAVNCGAIPESLMESAFFGHRRGAFTGAVDNKMGSFQAAHKGTIFLDEIGEMPVHLQVKLLRAIQEKMITRIGDNKPTRVDARIVVATNVDLEQAIRDGRFREDLYYRINVVSVHLPPLRDRGEDVVVIARYLLHTFAEELKRPVNGFSNEALIAMRKHAWPGNIRELQNRLKKALVLAEGVKITSDDLDLDEEALSDRVLPLADAKEAFQRRYIDQILALNDGNRTKTARDLGVDPRTIFRHLEKNRKDE